jgi:hypothetical protein
MHEGFQEARRVVAAERVVAALLELGPTGRESRAVDPEGVKERRIELRLAVGLADRELRKLRVELELELLQEEWVVDRPVRPLPEEDSLPENQFELFRLALQSAPEVEQSPEERHRLPDGPLRLLPGLPARCPGLERPDPFTVAVEALRDGIAVRTRSIPG